MMEKCLWMFKHILSYSIHVVSFSVYLISSHGPLCHCMHIFLFCTESLSKFDLCSKDLTGPPSIRTNFVAVINFVCSLFPFIQLSYVFYEGISLLVNHNFHKYLCCWTRSIGKLIRMRKCFY